MKNNKKKSKNTKNKTKDTTKIYNTKSYKENKNVTKLNPKKEKDIKKLEKQKKKEEKKKNRKHPKLWLTFKIFIIIIFLLIIIGIAAFSAIFFSDEWSISKEQLLSDSGLTIVDQVGNVLTTLTGDEISKKVTLSEMGKIPDAFIAIEDKRFYEHGGIDIIRTANAILNYGISIITGKDASFGGSTITQQLVKITMNDDARGGWAGIERKIREWSRAIQVEDMLTKEEILERYLNRIYLGSSGGLEVRGVESASNYYFSKTAAELDIAQAAFLAGINHSPNNYDPFNEAVDNTEEIKSRTKTVLYQMYDQGKISEEEYNNAVQEVDNGLEFKKGSASNGNSSLSYHAAAAINQVASEMSEQEDISYSEAREMLINSGYTLYTTVNSGIQEIAENAYISGKYNKTTTYKGEKISAQSAIVIIEPTTGSVVASVGGLGEGLDTLGINRINSERSAGSAFKPLVNIAPALENGTVVASTLFDDSPTDFARGYSPKDDSNNSDGIMTMRKALEGSKNIPEVKLLQLLGIDNAVEFLSKIGIEVDETYKNLPLALGTQTVTPLEMAAGYAMIANGGVYITPTFYSKLTDQNGNVVLEPKQEKTRVMSEGNAYILTSMLTGPIKGSTGTATRYRNTLGSMGVAGKTSTSSDAKDRWFCGFTPYYATACWYGYDNNESSVYGPNQASQIWFDVNKIVHQDLEVKDFVKPDNIVTAKICLDSGKKATDKCKNTYTEIFVNGTVPGDCNGHTTLKICKETKKIATEFCTDTEERVYTEEIDTEKAGNWTTHSLQNTTKPPTETCNVHTKAPEIDVPNVVGKTESEAKKVLESAGFKVKTLEDEDAKRKKGIVLKQSATKANKGATITITVNTYNGGSSGSNGGGSNNTTNSNTTTGDDRPTNSVNGGNTSTGGNTSKNETVAKN